MLRNSKHADEGAKLYSRFIKCNMPNKKTREHCFNNLKFNQFIYKLFLDDLAEPVFEPISPIHIDK
jgi:hypothetical protein